MIVKLTNVAAARGIRRSCRQRVVVAVYIVLMNDNRMTKELWEETSLIRTISEGCCFSRKLRNQLVAPVRAESVRNGSRGDQLVYGSAGTGASWV